MVEREASYGITASRTRSVKESTCWSRRGDLCWAASEWDANPLFSTHLCWLPFGYNSKSIDLISMVLMQFGTKYCQEYSFSQTAFKDLGCFKGSWAWWHTSPGWRLFLLSAVPRAGHFLEVWMWLVCMGALRSSGKWYIFLTSRWSPIKNCKPCGRMKCWSFHYMRAHCP